MKIVDAEPIINKLKFMAENTDEPMKTALTYCAWQLAYESSVDAITHGYWIEKSNNRLMCSVCKSSTENYRTAKEEKRYCYHCGAKMDGEANGKKKI